MSTRRRRPHLLKLMGLAVVVAGSLGGLLWWRNPPLPTAAAPGDPDPSPRQIVARIDAGFYRESTDSPWGRQAARRAAAVLPRLLTPGSTLGKVDCRETLCRIEARHLDLTAYRSFVMAVIRGRRTDGLWDGAVTSQAVERSTRSVSTVTYLAREGHPVPGTD